jgi:hypothetical protein
MLMKCQSGYWQETHGVSLTTSVENYTYRYSGLGDRIQQAVNGVTTTYVLDLNSGLTQGLCDGAATLPPGLFSAAGEGWDLYSSGNEEDRNVYNETGIIHIVISGRGCP